MSAVTVDAKVAHEQECHKWYTEASTLQFPVGQWPKLIETTLGNQMPFTLVLLNEERGIYHQQLGCLTLVVFND